jgi:hypothetical protein
MAERPAEKGETERPAEKDEAEEARRRFEEDLDVRGEAVPAGEEELPPGATHEIEEKGDGERTVRRRRFSTG